jgi:hypothetical protein
MQNSGNQQDADCTEGTTGRCLWSEASLTCSCSHATEGELLADTGTVGGGPRWPCEGALCETKESARRRVIALVPAVIVAVLIAFTEHRLGLALDRTEEQDGDEQAADSSSLLHCCLEHRSAHATESVIWERWPWSRSLKWEKQLDQVRCNTSRTDGCTNSYGDKKGQLNSLFIALPPQKTISP